MSHAAEPGAIAWRDWNEQAFAAATAEGKPVLLTLGATWCHWCHVMDQQAYSDQRVIDLVNSRFIPVRVDVDQRPDISLRYNQGTYPSVVFLTGDGQFLAGRPYTPADEMVSVLQQVSSGEAVPERPSGAGDASNGNGSIDAVLARLTELYDERFGGFAEEPKQPPWEALHFLAARYGLTGKRSLIRMVNTTLEGMWHGIYDHKDLGFFRYAVSRDWKVPHYEKMLVTNASLALSYAEGFQITRRPLYNTALTNTIEFIQHKLCVPSTGLLAASQDADEPYYQTSWKDREQRTPPAIDRTIYAGWNALAAHALIQAGNVLPRPAWVNSGSVMLDTIWEQGWRPSRGLARRADGSGDATPVLADQVEFLRALLFLHQSTGEAQPLARAIEVAQTTQRLFGASGGGCYDIVSPRSFEAALLPREQPVRDNAVWAESLLTLAYLTGDDSYAELAGAALDVFEPIVPGRSYLGSHASRRMEEDEEALFLPAGSAWGRAKSMQTHGPVSFVLVGDPLDTRYRRLLQASHRVYAPHRIVQQLDPQRDRDRIRELGFPPDRAPALYICMGDRCLAPITTREQLREAARQRPWAIS